MPLAPCLEKVTSLTAAERTMRLLIIEDDRESADYLVKAFREVGHIADHAADGEEGLAMAENGDYDVLVVDRMLPKRDGLSLIGALRDKGNTAPVLILSALGQVDDRIKGLRAGGDDYLPKPYSFAELLARVEVLSRRRGGPAEDTLYRVGDLELDRLSPSRRPRQGRIDASAARIPPARIPHEARRPGGDAHHAVGERLGLSFRSADQRDRRAHFAAALQDRQGF
ncbi:CheY-like chemotaxis protein [Bradyrhizobium japonicum]